MTATVPAPSAPAQSGAEAISAPGAPDRGLARSLRLRRLPSPFAVVIALTLVLGVLARFASTGALWLDESLSVTIARQSPHALLDALRIDGSPPLYYLLLHAWMAVFGTGTHGVRALSGALSVLALVPTWFAARRLADRRLAWMAVAILACSPFAIRYATETRMYSLLILEVPLFGLALLRSLELASPRRLAELTLAAAALTYTHYWSFFVLLPIAVALLARRRWRQLGAFAVATVLLVPQLPTLWFQLGHTGTPWAAATQPRAAFDTLMAWGGPPNNSWSPILGLTLVVLGLLGLLTIRQDDHLVVAPRRATAGMQLALVALVPLALAVAVTRITDSGFTVRYTAVAFPGYAGLVALGLHRLDRRLVAALMAVIAAAGTLLGTFDGMQRRTQAPGVAAELALNTRPGDLVIYCPDQLAPAVHRLIPPGRVEISYGDSLGPSRVDWVDYEQRNATLNPVAIARSYLARARDHAIAVVWATGYRTLEGQCEALVGQLAAARAYNVTVLTRDTTAIDGSLLTVLRPASYLRSAG